MLLIHWKHYLCSLPILHLIYTNLLLNAQVFLFKSFCLVIQQILVNTLAFPYFLHCIAQSLVLTRSAFLRVFQLLEAWHDGEAKQGSDGWLTNLPYRFLIIAQILVCAEILVSYMQQKYEISDMCWQYWWFL